ncbi:MAG: hypothetical protein P4L84_06990 [Isosphaeraceae bacterium]|nr:hypothetical protein [Isosphaeraceae bacterium]
MAIRKPSSRTRVARPSAEVLETRNLLSGVVSGTDIDGDKWTLQLVGPGSLTVTDVSGNPITSANASTPDSIGKITISGPDTQTSHLIGTVVKAPGGDGLVYFQNLQEVGGGELPSVDPAKPIGVLKPKQAENGIATINMPSFWLGNTSGTVPTPSSSLTGSSVGVAGKISIPDGIGTLQFGGVNTDYTPPGGTPLNTDNQNDQFQVNLGLPFSGGTSIIINKSITDAQAGQTTTSGTTGTPTQDTVYFSVAGRLNLFQANEVDGNTTFPPDQFTKSANATSTTAGGTFVTSGSGTAPFFLTGGTDTGGSVTGQIGFFRVGGNATNLTVAVFDAVNAADARIQNFFVGGETNNVLMIAPNGSRDVYFGLGADNVQINSEVISSLKANRGLIGSTITTTRGINSFFSGGDVVNSNVQSGYDLQNFLTFISNVESSGTPVPTVENRFLNTNTQRYVPSTVNDGHINALIAGDVTNSVFSASVEPNPSNSTTNNPGTFGGSTDVSYSGGSIMAKVEGKINNSSNSLVDSSSSNQAFFAKRVHLSTGPVIPPNVPMEPYAKTQTIPRERAVLGVNYPSGPMKKN